MADRVQLYLPVTRFVTGSMTTKRTLNARRQPISEDKQMFEFGLALPKDSPDAQAFWGQLINGFKQCFPNNQAVHQVIDQWIQNGFQGFSGKISDGDKPNLQGQVNENTKGCWVIWISTSYPPTTANDQNIQIDPATIERGYYVDGTISLAPNNNAIGDGIGCYVNCDMLRLRAQGEVIRGGVDTQQLGAQMPMGALPPGASPVGAPPVGGMPPPAGGMPGVPQQQAAPSAPPVPGAPMTAPAMPATPAPAPQPAGTAPQQQPLPGMATGYPTEPQQPMAGYPPHPGVLPQ